MAYIDGFVTAVPTANKAAYKAHAELSWSILRDLGAEKMMECWGDEVPDGKVTSFPMAVKKRDDETVVFSMIVWPSKQVRDAAMPKIMEDPRFDPAQNPMPFDGKRMIYGGFDVLLEVSA